MSLYVHSLVGLRKRLPVGGGCVYVLQLFFCFVFCFFPSTKTIRQPFSGTAERIFMKLSPNDGGECSLKRRAAAWRMANVDDCVIYDMTLSQSPEGATHGGCVIQP